MKCCMDIKCWWPWTRLLPNPWKVALACQLLSSTVLQLSWQQLPPEPSPVSRGNFLLLIKDVVCAIYLWRGMETGWALSMRKCVKNLIRATAQKYFEKLMNASNARKDRKRICQRRSLEHQNSKTRLWFATRDCHGLPRQQHWATLHKVHSEGEPSPQDRTSSRSDSERCTHHRGNCERTWDTHLYLISPAPPRVFHFIWK